MSAPFFSYGCSGPKSPTKSVPMGMKAALHKVKLHSLQVRKGSLFIFLPMKKCLESCLEHGCSVSNFLVT